MHPCDFASQSSGTQRHGTAAGAVFLVYFLSN
jgi:hypothetical protein